MSGRYLKQVIVIPRALHMPTGKIAAMAAHAAMTFILKRFRRSALKYGDDANVITLLDLEVTPDQAQWLAELDPGLEDLGQVSMAKIVCSVADEAELLAVEAKALAAKLECHRVTDSGHSHNKPRTLAALAIGPDWPERLEPVTGGLKVYR